MANENVLRRNWDTQFQQSPEMKAAEAAALRDRVAREAKFKGLKARFAGDPEAMMKVLDQERWDTGTGAGEIALETLRQAHTKEVSDYITSGKRSQQTLASKNNAFVNISAEPDFATHRPYAKNVRFAQGPMTGEQRAEKEIEAASWNGQTMNNREKIDAYQRSKARTIPQDIFDQHQVDAADQNRKVKAFDQGVRDSLTYDAKAQKDYAAAKTKNTRDVAVARGQAAPLIKAAASPRPINPNDFTFNRGGTMDRGGEHYDVPSGLGDGRKARLTAGGRDPSGALDESLNDPYGMTADDFVRAPTRTTIQPSSTPPSYPVVKPAGKARPSASLLETNMANGFRLPLGF
ncbi:MAG: hypothetical protein V4671_34080 [Armatimonadota bacterium]